MLVKFYSRNSWFQDSATGECSLVCEKEYNMSWVELKRFIIESYGNTRQLWFRCSSVDGIMCYKIPSVSWRTTKKEFLAGLMSDAMEII